MSLILTPYKLTLREMEARVPAGELLLPGQLLRFDSVVAPAYGEVSAVRTTPEQTPEQGCLVKIRLLHGTPALAPQSVTLLSEAQMAADVMRMLASDGEFELPLAFGVPVDGSGGFVSDFDRLGALTLVTGDDFVLKYEAMMMLVRALTPYQRLLVIDPLGLFSSSDGVCHLRAGEDVRLALHEVGGKRFLDAFGETFPERLRDLALRALADRLPVDAGFVPFSRLLDLSPATELPLKNLIAQSLQSAAKVGVFADCSEQVFSLASIAAEPVTVVDISAMPEPWKSLFYEELCSELYRNADSDVIPVLIYPESYLQQVEAWIQKADEAELNLILLASPYLPEKLRTLADNLLVVESRQQVHLSGALTLGMPVNFALPDAASMHIEPQISADAPAESEPEPILQAVRPLSPDTSRRSPASVMSTFPPSPPETQTSPWPAATEPRFQSADMPMSHVPIMESPSTPSLEPMSPEELIALMGGPTLSGGDLSARELIEHRPAPTPPPAATASALPASDPDYPDADEGALAEAPVDESLLDPWEAGPAEPVALSPNDAVADSELPLGPDVNVSAAYEIPADSASSSGATPAERADALHPPEASLSASETDASSLNIPESLLFGADKSEEASDEDDFSFDVDLDHKLATDAGPGWMTPEPASSSQNWMASSQEPSATAVESDWPTPGVTAPDATATEWASQEMSAASRPESSIEDLVPIRPKSLEMTETPAPSSASADVGVAAFKPGDRVRHEAYGTGVISKVVPMDGDVVVNVTFDTVGKRLLDPVRSGLVKE